MCVRVCVRARARSLYDCYSELRASGDYTRNAKGTSAASTKEQWRHLFPFSVAYRELTLDSNLERLGLVKQ